MRGIGRPQLRVLVAGTRASPEFSREFSPALGVCSNRIRQITYQTGPAARAPIPSGFAEPERERRISVCFPTESLELSQNCLGETTTITLIDHQSPLLTNVHSHSGERLFFLDQV